MRYGNVIEARKSGIEGRQTALDHQCSHTMIHSGVAKEKSRGKVSRIET